MTTANVKDRPAAGAPHASQQFATFLVDRFYFGVPVLQVQEVIRYQEMTRVPRAPVVVQGLINLRGQIVTAIDMRRRLGLANRDPAARPMNVVVRTSDGVVSLLVDEIGEVLEVQQEQHDAAPDTATSAVRSLVTGVYKLPGRLLLVLDVERVTAPQGFEVEK
jgi:purine-binding chemotaxis protein CheW